MDKSQIGTYITGPHIYWNSKLWKFYDNRLSESEFPALFYRLILIGSIIYVGQVDLTELRLADNMAGATGARAKLPVVAWHEEWGSPKRARRDERERKGRWADGCCGMT